MNQSDLVIIGVTGLPSSGKGVFGKIAKGCNFKILVMGDVIRNECKTRGLPINRESSDKVMFLLRKERGEDAVASVVIDWITEAINGGNTRILVDGIRSISEVKLFQKRFPNFKVIAVHSDPKTRLQRAMTRKRVDDAFSEEAFRKRDQLELEIGIGDVIAKPNILISSNQSLYETEKLYSQVLEDLLNLDSDVIYIKS